MRSKNDRRYLQVISLRYPVEFHLCLNIKRLTEEIFNLIGSTPLHPISLTPYGFLKIPLDDEAPTIRLIKRNRILKDTTLFFSDYCLDNGVHFTLHHLRGSLIMEKAAQRSRNTVRVYGPAVPELFNRRITNPYHWSAS